MTGSGEAPSASGLPRRAFCSGAATLLVAQTAHAACVLQRRADVPVRVIEGFPIVTASIGGTPVSLLLDTGAQGHLILPEAAAALGLAALPGVQTPIIGTGGARAAPVVMLAGLRLGGAALPALPTPVAALPVVPQMTPMLAGLLGAPLLDSYDLDLDVQEARMGLYDAGGCGAAVPTLGPRMTVLPLEVTREREAFLLVRINGQPLMALLDTGSRATLLTEQAARRLGLHAPISANTARGVDGERLPLQHVRVQEMAVGEDIRRNVPVSIAPLQLGRGDMLLGLDYLGLRRVWISYATGLLAIAAPGPVASDR